jgi:hydroxyacylglutathione hydrolase
MYFQQIFEPKLAQYAYLIGCQQTGEAIIVDPQRVICEYIEAANSAGLQIVAATETHIHADYLSGLRQIAHQMGVKVFASDEGDEDWKYNWLENSDYNYQLVKHGDKFVVGNIEFEVIHTPGHTPEHICFLVTDHGGGAETPIGLLTGDFVFVGDLGRPDLLEKVAHNEGSMKKSAEILYESVQKFKSFPEHLQLWPGHGSGSACGKALGAVPMSTVGYELIHNSSIKAAVERSAFVEYINEGQPEPPYYFARMKTDNRLGPVVLSHQHKPIELSDESINEIIDSDDIVIVDTRDWEYYRNGHLKGSLFAPLNKAFITVAGSYIEADAKIVLVIEPHLLNDAIEDLMRIGLDNVFAYISPQHLSQYFEEHGKITTTKEIDMLKLQTLLNTNDLYVLDVRRMAELKEIGSIPGAYNIAHTSLLTRKDELPDDRTIYVYCRTGVRSCYASSYLEKLGHDFIHVSGGFYEWRDIGGKIVEYDPTI